MEIAFLFSCADRGMWYSILMKYKACFFDLYGTLMDIHTDESLPVLWETMSSWYASHKAKYTPAGLREAYLRLVREETGRVKEQFAGEGVLTGFPEPEIGNVFCRLFEEKGAVSQEDLVRETALLFRRTCRLRLRLYAGAEDLLVSLKETGAGVYLLSNAQSLFTKPELQETGIFDLFDDIFISSDAGVKKPEPLFFQKALEKTGYLPADCLMVGNDIRCDMEGAVSAGMSGYYILSNLSPKEDREKELPSSCMYQKGMDLKLVKKRILVM